MFGNLWKARIFTSRIKTRTKFPTDNFADTFCTIFKLYFHEANLSILTQMHYGVFSWLALVLVMVWHQWSDIVSSNINILKIRFFSAIFAAIESTYSRLDLVINNAGIAAMNPLQMSYDINVVRKWVMSSGPFPRQWTPFGRRHFQVHFFQWKFLNCY